jgi:TonB family protein
MKISGAKHILVLYFIFLMAFLPAHAQQTYNAPPDNFGGKAAFRNLIIKEMYYPPEARKNKIEGEVKLRFIVNADGLAENVEFVKSVHPALDNEAIRLFEMLLWEPALKAGKKVEALHDIRFDFKIKKYKKFVKQRGYDKTFENTANETDTKIFHLPNLTLMPKPVFDDSSQKYSDFIATNMKYPEAAAKQNITGTVEVFFVVEPTGRPTNIKILQGIGAGCNEEAMRLAELLRWKPGTKNNRPVRSEMTLNITFNLSGAENIRYVPANNQNQF